MFPYTFLPVPRNLFPLCPEFCIESFARCTRPAIRRCRLWQFRIIDCTPHTSGHPIPVLNCTQPCCFLSLYYSKTSRFAQTMFIISTYFCTTFQSLCHFPPSSVPAVSLQSTVYIHEALSPRIIPIFSRSGFTHPSQSPFPHAALSSPARESQMRTWRSSRTDMTMELPRTASPDKTPSGSPREPGPPY